MKRNLVDEIIEIRSRSEEDSRLLIRTELFKLESVLDKNFDDNLEAEIQFLKYIPIATVASFEAFFRSVIKDLIDFGDPYSNNAIKFNQAKNVKFDFEIINAIQKSVVTIGEFISHILPCNNLEDINANLSTLCEIDFIQELKKFKNKTVLSRYSKNTDEFTSNANQIIADIKTIFKLRHIFCHEFATNIEINKSEITRCFLNAIIFLDQVDDFMLYLLYPDAPETQADMTNQAYEELSKLERKFNETLEYIRSNSEKYQDMDSIDLELFNEMIEEWKKYRDAKGKLEASSVKGGSLYPFAYSNSLITTTQQEIVRLRHMYKIKD